MHPLPPASPLIIQLQSMHSFLALFQLIMTHLINTRFFACESLSLSSNSKIGFQKTATPPLFGVYWDMCVYLLIEASHFSFSFMKRVTLFTSATMLLYKYIAFYMFKSVLFSFIPRSISDKILYGICWSRLFYLLLRSYINWF